MPQWVVWAVLGGTFFIFLLVQVFSGSKKPLRKAVGTMALGLCAMLVVNLSAFFTGVSLPVSTLSLCVASIGGIPGVTLMLVLNMFF